MLLGYVPRTFHLRGIAVCQTTTMTTMMTTTMMGEEGGDHNKDRETDRVEDHVTMEDARRRAVGSGRGGLMRGHDDNGDTSLNQDFPHWIPPFASSPCLPQRTP